jgi:hypothetical protein
MNCLVPGNESISFVALSYRWAISGSFQTTKNTLNLLLQEKSLTDEEIAGKIPKTVCDAMNLVRELGQRYLWVDALCIVQDDKESKMQDIHNMAAVYANATFTIVAADGDASTGLTGFRHVHLERASVPFDKYTLMPTPFKSNNDLSIDLAYSSRGWTFQEYLFAGRKLILYQGMAHWECSCATWHDDRKLHDPSEVKRDRTGQLLGQIPNMSIFLPYVSLVHDFNWRDFTYEEDAVHAVAGIFTALSTTFQGGFLFGIPEMYFEVGLLWTLETAHRRKEQHRKRESGLYPSWTWLRWKGDVHFQCMRWENYIIPVTQWYAIKEPGDANKRPIHTIGYPNPFIPDDKYRYPSEAIMTPPHYEMYITCKTHTAQLYVDCYRGYMDVKDADGNTTGTIWMKNDSNAVDWGLGPKQGISIDLVAICGQRNISIDLVDPRTPEGGIYHYLVMWVEWIDNIAYRKGIGEVARDIWEKQQLKLIDLVLG